MSNLQLKLESGQAKIYEGDYKGMPVIVKSYTD
jgi:hypothetical protein